MKDTEGDGMVTGRKSSSSLDYIGKDMVVICIKVQTTGVKE